MTKSAVDEFMDAVTEAQKLMRETRRVLLDADAPITKSDLYRRLGLSLRRVATAKRRLAASLDDARTRLPAKHSFRFLAEGCD